MTSALSLALRFTVLLAGFSTTATSAAPTAVAPAVAPAAATGPKAAYPLKTCVVSGGKLGGMGKPVEYLYKQSGQPDRTVIFCCKACIRKFEKDPAPFLAKLDSARTTAHAATTKSSAP